MKFILFYFLAFLVILLIVIGLIYFAYWFPKKYGKKKLGIWLAGILTLIFLSPIISIAFGDYLFFKSDAVERLSEHNFKLGDDFKIISNKSTGLGDYQCFVLEISKSDKEKIKNQILNANNFQIVSDVNDLDISEGKPRYSERDTIFTANYRDSNCYFFESYKPDKPDYAPVVDIISISKTENKLTFQRIWD